MIGAVFQALLSHWRRHPGQALTLVAGLALATALWTAVQAINAEARASYATASALLAPDRAGTLTAPSGTIALDDYVALRRAGWQVSAVLEGRLSTSNATLTLMGIDLLTYPSQPLAASDDAPAIQDVLTAPGRLFADAETATHVRAGDLPPVFVTDTVPPGVVMTDIAVAERLLNRPRELSRIVVLRDQPLGLQPLADLVPHLVLTPPDTTTDAQGLTRSFHLNLTAFGLLSFAVGLFIVHGTIGLAFEQRRDIFRSLRALGVPASGLGAALGVELISIGLLAGMIGVGLGYIIAAALLPGVAATLDGLYGAQVAGGLALRPGWVASGIAMALGGVVLAGGQMVWRIRSLPILALTGAEAWRQVNARSFRIQILLGVVLIAGGICAVLIFDGLLAGFALLGGLMLGAAMMLPPLLALLLHLGGQLAKGPVAQWVWADMRAQLPGLSLALTALLLALATNVGVGTMVSSFRLTFTDWLDQRLSADLYVSTRDADQTAALTEWLTPRAQTVLPVRYAQVHLLGQPGRIYAVPDDQTYRETWPVVKTTDDAWDRLADGTGVMINEQLFYRADLALGRVLPLASDWAPHIVGVYADYGNAEVQAIAGTGAVLEHFADLPNRQLAIRSDRPAALAAELRQAFDLPADAIQPQTQIKALSLEIFDRTFLVTGALNLLTLGVAGFAILTSLLTLWTMRLPTLAPAWALGLTRARLARLEILRAVALASLTAVAALPLGLILAWTLLAVINIEAFGWRLPMYLFPADWARLFGLSLTAAALAALIPALKLRRLPPAALVQVFANVR